MRDVPPSSPSAEAGSVTQAMTLATMTGLLLYAARRYFRNWGTTKQECRMPLPGDELMREPVLQTTEGVRIGRPAGEVWPWLLQMGQDRGRLAGRST